VEVFIAEYLDDGLEPEELVSFEAHLVTCAECTTYLTAYRVTIKLGKSAFAVPDASADQSVPDDLIRAILAARAKSS